MTEPPTFDYRLPSLGADMDEGRVLEWRVSPGDTVHRGDIMAVVETEKSDIDIEIWHDGVVESFLVDIGVRIDVGTPIVRLRAVGDAPEPTATAGPTPAAGSITPESITSETSPPAGGVTPARAATRGAPAISAPAGADRVPASPLARRVAAERGIDLATVTGTGPGGAVVRADLDRAEHVRPDAGAGRADVAPAAQRSRSVASMRSAIAERMSRSNREIPHYHLARDVDLGRLTGWLEQRNADRPITERLLPVACYVRAVALAAARHRELNGFWVDDHFEPADEVNVAMVISLRRGGLVAPHIASADQRTLEEIMSAITEMVGAARTGTLRSSWMTGSTLTLTNLGDTGADLVHGVISPPEVALVGVGRTRPRPWVVGDLVSVRPIATVTLAADHRATDGAIGSRFLAAVADELEQLTNLEASA
jgi:pyruvate dehydrogenase E2 component (dihydrolipoamide acetyltransferase)